jgi:uncharacterized protein
VKGRGEGWNVESGKKPDGSGLWPGGVLVPDLRTLYSPGQEVRLEFRKWDDRLHYHWQARMLEVFADRVLVGSLAGTVFHHVSREQTITLEHDARLAFWQGGWFSGGPDLEPGTDRVIEYYFNIGTPPEFSPDRIVAIDLELDLKARPDLSSETFDLDEFLEAKQHYGYPDWLERRVKLAALEVRELLSRAAWPVPGVQALDPNFAWLDRLNPPRD